MPKFQTTILFDLDGTLIDSTSAILDGFHYAFSRLGTIMPSDDEIKSLIGYPLDEMFAKLGVSDGIDEHVRTYKEKYMGIYLEQTVLLEGAYKAVKLASTFANLGVVTTKTSKFSRILLESLGISEFFGVIIGREDVTCVKPNPEPILNALKALNVRASKRVYMIGDTKLDAIAARESGVRSVGVACGYGDETTLKEHCDYICADSMRAVQEIYKISKNLLK